MIAGGGYGFGRALASQGYGFAVGTEEDVVYGGAGYPVYRKWKKLLTVGEMVDEAVRKLYEEVAEQEDTEVKRKITEVVKPFVSGDVVETMPEAYKIDWKAFTADISRIEKLLKLYQQTRDDELIVMAYIHFYH